MKKRIPVNEVGPGMFSTERFVLLEVEGEKYSLFVDVSSLSDDEKTLEVDVVGFEDGHVLVELPRDMMNAGSRLRLATESLLPA